MTDNEKKILNAYLSLDSKLSKSNYDISDEAAVLNTAASDSTTVDEVESILSKYVDDVTDTNKDKLKAAIDTLTCADTSYFDTKIGLNILFGKSKPDVAAAISTALDQTYSCKTDLHEFLLYSQIVQLTIYADDSALTEKALTKIQSL